MREIDSYRRLQGLLAESPIWGEAYPGYVEFVAVIVSGDRNRALHHVLRPFVATAANWPFADRILFVDALCRLIDKIDPRPRAVPYDGIPYPLLAEVVHPTLVEWIASDESAAYAYLWLAVLPEPKGANVNVTDCFASARKLAPQDERIAKHEVRWLLDLIAWDCHHLPQTLLAPAETILSRIRDVSDRLSMLAQKERNSAFLEMRDAHERIQTYLDAHGGRRR